MALQPFSSQLIAVTGISMGDEGKGRLVYEIIDELVKASGRADIVGMVLKVNGGANSGHTVAGIKLNLLPAGVVAKNVEVLGVGCGVVADPRKFLWEGTPLERKGYSIFERLLIDERTLVSDVSHRVLDLAWEDYRVNVLGEEPRGSTGRGITPAYCDEVGQWQIYYADFRGTKEAFGRKLRQRMRRAADTIRDVCRIQPENWKAFFEKLTAAEARANAASVDEGIFPPEAFDFVNFCGDKPFTFNEDAVIEAYWNAGRTLVNRVGDLRECVLNLLHGGRSIIGEFGQSYWLDKRQGFSPNVTASHTFTPEIFQSAGIPTQPVHNVGCCKAYDTKVGTHIFLTEMDTEEPLAKRLRQMEFGTSTGRQRMVGWFDACEKGDALRFGGYQDMAINKLDALSVDPAWTSAQRKLKVCTGYRAPDGAIVRGVPRDDAFRSTLKPVYAELEGWTQDISNVRSFVELPLLAQQYVAFLVKAVLNVASREGKSPGPLPVVRYVGTGPGPSQIIKDVPDTLALLKLAPIVEEK